MMDGKISASYSYNSLNAHVPNFQLGAPFNHKDTFEIRTLLRDVEHMLSSEEVETIVNKIYGGKELAQAFENQANELFEAFKAMLQTLMHQAASQHSQDMIELTNKLTGMKNAGA